MGAEKVTSINQRALRRSVVVTFAWLFIALAMLALLSAPDATHDEMFHAVNIWCGHGERSPYCEGIRFDVEYPGATVNFDHLTCLRDLTVPLICPSGQSGTSFRSINHGNLYPGIFYFALSWFVVPSFEVSVILTRIVSAFIVSFMLGLLVLFLPERYRTIALLVVLTTLPSTGYYLFASINPSSWTVFGVAFGWLPLHAAVTSFGLTRRSRIALLVVSFLISMMAAGSRWDGLVFLLFAFACVAFHAIWNQFPKKRLTASALTLSALGVLLLLVNLFVPVHVQPVRLLRLLITYSPGEPDNVTFLSHYLLQGIPNALRALGSVPTGSGISLPAISWLINIVILSGFMVVTRDSRNKVQSFGTVVILLTMSTVIASQVALIDNRDPFGVEPRYSLPLLTFAVGWWFCNGPANLESRVANHMKIAIPVATSMFALLAFVVAERFIDVQTFGIRFLPEGPDQWWWSRMPVGPNIVLLIAVMSIWQFMRRMPHLMAASEIIQ